jgi:hypothetical protein
MGPENSDGFEGLILHSLELVFGRISELLNLDNFCEKS